MNKQEFNKQQKSRRSRQRQLKKNARTRRKGKKTQYILHFPMTIRYIKPSGKIDYYDLERKPQVFTAFAVDKKIVARHLIQEILERESYASENKTVIPGQLVRDDDGNVIYTDEELDGHPLPLLRREPKILETGKRVREDELMGNVVYTNAVLDRLNDATIDMTEDGHCVPDYLVYELNRLQESQRFSKQITKDRLLEQFKDCGIDVSKGVSTRQIFRWAEMYFSKNLNIYALDPFYKVFKSRRATTRDRGHTISLVFIVSNNHCYAVLHPRLKQQVAQGGSLKLDELDRKLCEKGEMELTTTLPSSQDVNRAKALLRSATFLPDRDDPRWDDFIEGKLNDEVVLVGLSLTDVCADLSERHKRCDVHFASENASLDLLRHPVRGGQIIVSDMSHTERMDMCTELSKHWDVHAFHPRLQSSTVLAQSLYEVPVGQMPMRSEHSQSDLAINDLYPVRAFNYTVESYISWTDRQPDAYDVTKCYYNAMKMLECDIPIFHAFDHWRKYKGEEIGCGEYLVDAFTDPKTGMPYQRTVMSWEEVLFRQRLHGSLPIIGVRKASFSLSPSHLKRFAQEIEKIFPGAENGKILSPHGKTLANCFIGNLSQRFTKTVRTAVLSDWDGVERIINTYLDEIVEGEVEITDGTFFNLHYVKLVKKRRNDKDRMSISNAILGRAHCIVLDMIDKVWQEGTKLVGIKTDCAFLYNAKPIPEELQAICHIEQNGKPIRHKPFDDRTKEPVELKESTPPWNSIPDITIDNKRNKVLSGGVEVHPATTLNQLVNQSMCVVGIPGAGKSTLLLKLLDTLPEDSKVAILSFQNKPLARLKKELGPRHQSCVMTFDVFMMSANPRQQRSLTHIFVDEFSTCPANHLVYLAKIKEKNPSVVIQLYGDPNQVENWSPNHRRFFDYLAKDLVREMCGYRLMEKSYIDGHCRYTKELYDVLDSLLSTGHLPESLQNRSFNPNDDADLHITFFAKESKPYGCTAINKRVLKGRPWYPGMPVISNVNKKPHLQRSARYVLDTIAFTTTPSGKVPKSVTLKGVEGSFSPGIFSEAFAITVNRIQGDTIEGNIMIHDIHRMSRNKLYTALSRARSLDNVYFQYTDRWFPLAQEPKESTDLLPKSKSIGYIYEAYSKQLDSYYIGQTSRTVSDRMTDHKNDNNDTMYKESQDWEVINTREVHFFKQSTLTDKSKLTNAESEVIAEYQCRGLKLANKLQKVKDPLEVLRRTPTVPLIARRTPEEFLQEFSCISFKDKAKKYDGFAYRDFRIVDNVKMSKWDATICQNSIRKKFGCSYKKNKVSKRLALINVMEKVDQHLTE